MRPRRDLKYTKNKNPSYSFSLSIRTNKIQRKNRVCLYVRIPFIYEQKQRIEYFCVSYAGDEAVNAQEDDTENMCDVEQPGDEAQPISVKVFSIILKGV